MMKLRINGEEYLGFTEISVVDNIDTLCQQFKVVCAAEDSGFMFPIKRGSSAEVIVEGVSVFNGSVEKSKGRAGQDSYDISTEGRDINSDIIKSQLRPDINFKGPISLYDLILKTLRKMGINRNVVDLTGGIDDLTKKELANEDVGTDLFDYWVMLAQKRNCLVSSNRDGEIIIIRPNQRKYTKRLYRLITDRQGANNIIESDWDFDDSERCHEYNVYSQTNRSSEDKKTPPASDSIDTDPNAKTDESESTPENQARISAILAEMNFLDPSSERFFILQSELEALGGSFTGGSSGQSFRKSRVATIGTAFDDGVPSGSVRHEVADDPSDDDECQRLANWKCNKTRAESVSYSCTVFDMLADDEPWESGWLVDVVDEVADIDSTMLIRSVEYNSSRDENGQASEDVTLTLTLPDAYTDQPSADSSLVTINRIGANWNDGDFN